MHQKPGRSARLPAAADRAATWIASLLLIAAALMSPLLAGISGMRSTGCEGTCRYDLVGAGSGVIVIGPVVAAAVVLAAIALVRRRGRALWWLPCLGLAVSAAALLVGERLIDAGAGG